MYILDTDVLSLMFRFPGQQPHLEQHVKATPYERLYVSVISVEQAIRGAFRLRDNERNPVGCYNLLSKIVMYYGRFQILSYDEECIQRFNGFSPEVKHQAGDKADRQIAATALAHGYIVVTRNGDHFWPTGVRCEDWTIA